jgi:vancomycin resistance protein VanJ
MKNQPESADGGARRQAARVSPGRLLLAATDLYTALVIFYLIAHTLTGDRLWPVTLLAFLAHWLLLPGFVLVPGLFLARQRWRAALAGVSVVAFLALFGGLFLPKVPASTAAACPPDECVPLTAMTYNLLTNATDPDALVEMLRDSGADIVALQEVSPSRANLLERELAAAYPHRVLYDLGIPGVGLLSRHPILEHELFYLQAQTHPYLRATLDVEGAPLTVIVAHPPPPGLVGRTIRIHPQAPLDIASVTEMAASGGPTLLLGDFNFTDQNDVYRIVTRAGLRDAFREAGWGFGLTHPRRLPQHGSFPLLTRIDFIFYTGDFEATRAWVGPDAGSDHLPVLAELVWRR